MSKEELAKLVLTDEELNKIDYALPLYFTDHCKEMGIDYSLFVWSYHDNGLAGAPLDLSLRLCKAIDFKETLLILL